MISFDNLLKKLCIENNNENRKKLKSIINALIKNSECIISKQLINVDIDRVCYLLNILNSLEFYFDYTYNTKIDLTNFLYYVINGNSLNLNAIFCPGYTENGYKNYIGENNSKRLETLKFLSLLLSDLNILYNIKISLADIFLENTNSHANSNWKKELLIHEKEFYKKANNFFDDKSIIKLSDVFSDKKFLYGFIDVSLEKDKTYKNFYKNNIEFYKKMDWDDEQIRYRNEKLYTIYSIISKYVSVQSNGIYLPMETMYSRSKVMTHNGVCTMYLHKR